MFPPLSHLQGEALLEGQLVLEEAVDRTESHFRRFSFRFSRCHASVLVSWTVVSLLNGSHGLIMVLKMPRICVGLIDRCEFNEWVL